MNEWELFIMIYMSISAGFRLTMKNNVVKNFATDLSLGELTLVVECGKFYSKNISQTIGKYIYYDY